VARLKFDGVGFHYPATARPALTDIDLTVDAGEIVALIGRVGAGASTTLLVAGDLAPRVVGGALTGRVTRDGRPAIVLPTPWTQSSGMAFTVRDEVAFGPANLGWPRVRIRAASERVLAELEIAPLAERDPATLSGGELQRVIIAGILAVEPDLLLLDEFTAELDPAGVELAWRVVTRTARERGVAVLVASSDLDAVARYATRVVWLEAGHVRAAGSPQAVLGSEEVWGSEGPGGPDVAAVWRAAGRAAPYPITVAGATTVRDGR
jgi:energy-coupling factor transporter ATP-binding protein EcfA2